jgi:DNA ligase (NAD+)
VRELKSIDQLSKSSFDELIQVEEIGSKIAESIISWFANDQNRLLVGRLKGHQLCFESKPEQKEGQTDKLNGLSILISGTFTKFSRDEIKAFIELHGGKNVTSISAKTSYLIAGENIGPSKLEKAQKLKIPIISEDDLLRMTN